MSDKPTCCYCGTTEKELRPYGPKGAWLCFSCLKASPEREKEAKQQFSKQLDACGHVAVVGTEVGPHPIEHSMLRNKVKP